MGYYSVIKRNELSSLEKTRRILKFILLMNFTNEITITMNITNKKASLKRLHTV